MKKLIVTTACLFSITTVLNAQQPTTIAHPQNPDQHVKNLKKETPEQHAQKNVDELNVALTLTEDQKTKIYDLAITRIKNIAAVKEKYKGQQDKNEVANTEIQTYRKTYRQSVKALLTAEQLAKVKAAKEAKEKKEGIDEDPLEGKK